MRKADIPLSIEDEDAFLLRRAEDERLKIAQSSCVVRSVHEELLETYQERLGAAAAETTELEALMKRIDEDGR